MSRDVGIFSQHEFFRVETTMFDDFSSDEATKPLDPSRDRELKGEKDKHRRSREEEKEVNRL